MEPSKQLTDKQNEVRALVCNERMSDAAIAAKMKLELASVRNHISAIRTRLGVYRTADICTADNGRK